MSLPGSSSFPAEYPEKLAECDAIGPAMRVLLEKNLLPRDIMTRQSFENAMVSFLTGLFLLRLTRHHRL